MRYYSDVLGKFFNTARECAQAEAKYEDEKCKKEVEQAKIEEQKKMALEDISNLADKINELKIKLEDKVTDYCKKYKEPVRLKSVSDTFSSFFDYLISKSFYR